MHNEMVLCKWCLSMYWVGVSWCMLTSEGVKALHILNNVYNSKPHSTCNQNYDKVALLERCT